jgi:hypothetical protein
MSHPYPVDQHHEILCERMAWLLRFQSKEQMQRSHTPPGDHSNDDLEIVLALLKQAKADEKIMTEANDFVKCGIPIYQLIL